MDAYEQSLALLSAPPARGDPAFCPPGPSRRPHPRRRRQAAGGPLRAAACRARRPRAGAAAALPAGHVDRARRGPPSGVGGWGVGGPSAPAWGGTPRRPRWGEQAVCVSKFRPFNESRHPERLWNNSRYFLAPLRSVCFGRCGSWASLHRTATACHALLTSRRSPAKRCPRLRARGRETARQGELRPLTARASVSTARRACLRGKSTGGVPR